MEIVIHCGAHCTDDDSLLRCIIRNKLALNKSLVAAPPRRVFRDVLRDTLDDTRVGQDMSARRNKVLSTVLGKAFASTERVIFSNPNFLGQPNRIVGGGHYYSSAVARVETMMRLFENDNLSLFLCIRNPATHLPVVFRYVDGMSFTEFLNGTSPIELEWKELILRLRDTFPKLKIVSWCYEDLPLIWGELVRRIVDRPLPAPFTGEFDIIAEIMSHEGMQRFETYFLNHPDMSFAQQRRVIKAFLSKYIRDDVNEIEFELPDCDMDMFHTITDLYNDDVEALRATDGIDFIGP